MKGIFFRRGFQAQVGLVCGELLNSAEISNSPHTRRRVEVFSTTAILPKRLGDTNSVQNPRISRSHAVRFGLRRCERFMISNWCLTASDSAATARTPPGPVSRARSDQQVGDQNKQQPHREPSFRALRSFRKSAQQLGLLLELPLRHTQLEISTEVGRRKAVGGQEDMMIIVAYELSQRRSTLLLGI